MSKIFRFSGYWVDGTDDYDAERVEDILKEGIYRPLLNVLGQHIHVDEADFEWYDELPIIQENCDLGYLEEYFKDLPTKYEDEQERTLPKPGETWKHFKIGKTVKIVAVSRNSENPTQELVTYECNNGLYTRPLDMFMSKTDKAKYPDAEQEYRFEKVEDQI